MRGVRHRLAAGAAAGLILLTLAGCSGSPGTGGAEPPAASPTELTVLTTPSISAATMANLNQEFIAKHPNVKINLKEGMGKPLLTGGQADPATLDGVDVVMLHNPFLAPLVDGNMLKDLSAVKLPPPNDALAGIWSDLGKVNGKQFGVPVAVSPPTAMVNDQALQRAGVKSLPADWTWQDFEQALTTVKAAGGSTCPA